MESKGVQILGIWGMSGIGKTAIARVAFEKFSSRYEGSYFLDNVREESQKHGLKSLREKLIAELQEEKSTFIRRKLIRRRKVLVVLDDVDAPEQLRHLVTEGFHWGPGSRVIVTSQNKQALIAGGVPANFIHEVKKLDFEESLNLFSLNAFNNSHPGRGYKELSKQAAAYADGLPLALKVLGLHLCSCDRETWKSTLGKLEMYPHPQIQDVLKMSFEGLDDVERDIFLDIAFFYKGEDKDHVKRLLDANNLFAADGIKGLLDKALISISNDNVIQMHDLIQEMGWEIVRQECKENPGRRSRLKDFEEVYDVLKNNKGTDAIKGIALYASLFKDVRLNVDTFKNMTNLRVVKFYSSWHVRCCNVHPPTSFLSFSDELRRLKWDGYPHPYPEKLVGHSMPNNHVGKLWKLVQDYVNSKRMSLDSSKQSMELLDFTKAQKTEWEDMCSCQGFCNVNSHILSLSMIAAVNLVRSKDSKKHHSESNFRSLINFDVGLCFSVRVFSSSSKEISELDFVTSKFEILCSSSVRGVSELRRITHGDSRPEIVPLNELCCLRFFEELSLSDCRQMNQSPELRILFDALLYLRELFMNGCSVFFKSPHTICTSSSFNYLTDLCIQQSQAPARHFASFPLKSGELVLVTVAFKRAVDLLALSGHVLYDHDSSCAIGKVNGNQFFIRGPYISRSLIRCPSVSSWLR
ncbi:putative disease resistance protein At4g11170 [Neltuma alba]|uniref:putative disease resistance protein At4g11170 n=1 Tax=Neltuma alba TaxID=207710 RepID=UPI0010A2B1D6|nr:putative disease resistance protein At4g11170 [Prosopis alba]